MANDVLIAKQMQKSHPNQVVIIHYEDIANSTKTAADYVYRYFCTLIIAYFIMQYIHENTTLKKLNSLNLVNFTKL